MNLTPFLLFASLLGSPSQALVAQDVPAPPAAESVVPVQEIAKVDVLGAMAWVPKGASAVILVNHPSRTLAAMDRLAKRMKLKGARLMRQTLVDDFGGEPLMDLETSLVEFSYPLPGEKNEAASKTVQLRIMRVPSMKEFAARFKAKAAKSAKTNDGGFFEGQVKGKPMLAAFRGGYAILAPKANLATLKAALAEREVFPLPPQPQRDWLLDQDVAMLFPVAVLAGTKADFIKKKDEKKDNFLAPVDALMELVRKNPEGEVSHIAIGAKTEEGGGISFEARLGFIKTGQAARVVAGLRGSLADVVGAATKGLPASAYVMAMTAVVPAGYVPWLNSTLASRGATASVERKERLTAMSQAMQGIKSFGFVWGFDAQSAKPLKGAVISMQVDDAEASLKALEAYAKLKPESGEAVASERSEHMGRTLLKVVVPSPKPQIPKEGEEPKRPMVDSSAIFGKEPVATLFWAYDPHTVLVGFGDAPTAFASSLQALEHPEKSLGQLPAFALTQDMLGSEQQMQLFLSLQDIIAAVTRMMPIPIELSANAKTAPPLGLGFSLASSGITLRAVAPGETVELVGTILESALKMSQDAKAETKVEETSGEGKAHKPARKKAPAKTKKAVKKKD